MHYGRIVILFIYTNMCIIHLYSVFKGTPWDEIFPILSILKI